MKVLLRPLGLMLLAASALVSCQSDSSYHPANPPEKEQFELAKLTVYPDDVRTNLDQYTNTLVAWAGIIRSTDAIEAETGGKIYSETIFENHYFDWQEDKTRQGVKLLLSPSGEGQFRSELHLRKATQDATGYDAEKYIARGKLAIVYGVPQKVEDGAVVLRYRYLRLFQPWEFTIHEFDFGRFGEPYHYLE